ncbi:AAA family ATPase [Alkalicoccobacillus gibsonii]|uniref:AAA family ATPase n=1 Tax=Alkalicoccobacillus gibsonii TaxID=79881 RepID=UPI003516F95F
MNNILDVRLENFQSHLDSQFTFADGLNVLIGQSDSGKTAVIRGIRWALFNQPRGTDFIRAGSDFVRVTIQFESGDRLIRERTASKNRYMIKKNGQEQQVFESFGQHVPQEVLDLHGMRPLRIDRDHELTIHLAQQLDGPFLLEQPGSMRAKTIGRISGAHYLDAAIRDTSRDLHSLNQSKRWSEEQTEQLKKDLEPYEQVIRSGEQLEKASHLFEEIKSKQARLESLQSKHQDLHTNQGLMKQSQDKLDSLKELPTIELMLYRLEWMIQRQSVFKKLHEQQQTYTEQLLKVERFLQLTESIEEAAERERRAKTLVQKRAALIKLNDQYTQLTAIESKAYQVISKTKFVTQIPSNWEESVKQTGQRVKRLISLKDQIMGINEQLAKQQKQLETVAQIEMATLKVNQIDETYNKYQQMIEKKQAYTEIRKRMKDGEQFIQTKKQELEQLAVQYEELAKKDGICPTCGQVIQTNHNHG